MSDTLNTTFLHSPFSQKYVSLISIRATSYRSDERGMKSLALGKCVSSAFNKYISGALAVRLSSTDCIVTGCIILDRKA